MAGSPPLLVAAIDFGTTFSGVAFSLKYQYDREPTQVVTREWIGASLVTMKAPTSVLITSDGQHVDSFGYDAETKFCELAEAKKHNDWYFFKKFKMKLYGDKNISMDTKLEDYTGKKLSALKVFSLSIAYLKNFTGETAGKQVVEGVCDDEIHWVITVPAIWSDTAKQFMRKAAEMADIDGERLTIALEPEAASIFCSYVPFSKCRSGTTLQLSALKSGSKYLVLDAGGGTVDITVHERTDEGYIKEVFRATGGAWGGTKVDEAFDGFLRDLFGDQVFDTFRKNLMEDYLELCQEFELKKKKLQPATITLHIPLSLLSQHTQTTGQTLKASIESSVYAGRVSILNNKLRVDISLIKALFLPAINSIVSHVRQLLQMPSLKGCGTILMVGGFSECSLLQERIVEAFPVMKIVVPDEAGVAVLKGAVIFGHNPAIITERVCKYTYGQKVTHIKSQYCKHPPSKSYTDKNGSEWCDNIFDIHVRKGQSVKFGEKQMEIISAPNQSKHNSTTHRMYASTVENPVFVTDDGCQMIGEFTCYITGGVGGLLGTRFLFSGTEIEVYAEDKRTGETTKHRVKMIGYM